MADPDVQLLHEFYRHSRNSAVALSVTTIGVSGAMLVRLEQLQTVWLIKGPFQIAFVVCIILGLLLQYRHYQGYRAFSEQGLIELLGSNGELKEAEELGQKANRYFTQLEKIAKWDFNLCVYGIAAFFIFNAGLEIGQWFSS